MRHDIPNEFRELTGKIDYVREVVRGQEWSSSCPRCGGSVHSDGEFPDRFRMWTNAKGKNKVFGWCRSCSYVWFPTNKTPISPEEFEAWRVAQIEKEQQKKREAEEAIRQLRSQKLWEFYHVRLTEWAFEVLNEWGICKENVDFWKLGFIEDYVVNGDYHSPAISIPMWNYGWEVRNVAVRVLNPRNSHDRYRALYKVGRDLPFVARPDMPSSGKVLVVEGQKKAMVVAATKQDIQVVGVSTKTPSPETLKELSDYERVYLCLDPDAHTSKAGVPPLTRMMDILGRERCWVVNLPDKVDDMILHYNLNIEDALRYAKPAR